MSSGQQMIPLDDLEVTGGAVMSNDCRVDLAREEWLAKRRGKITGSEFPTLCKSGRAKDDLFAKPGYAYLRQVVAERLGSYVHDFTSRPTSWGNEFETEAIVEGYGKREGAVVAPNAFGLILWDECDGIGTTPDALVDDEGVLEIKCPWNPAVHVNTALTGLVPDEYLFQVYGHLLITGRNWCDFISYDPRIDGPESVIRIRVMRDNTRQRFLADRLFRANQWVEEQVKTIRERAAKNGDGLWATFEPSKEDPKK